jgi:L-seryl-tRNA(Ser) seleniumtransferase
LQAGVDLVCFSGDKLLGGPQAGIIVGKEEYISRMKKNPLTRALRVDKMTLAALEETLRQYLEGEPFQTIPTLHMLTASVEELQQRYEKLEGMLKGLGGLTCERMESQAPAGGGSLPGVMLPTICMAVSVEGMTSDRLEKKLRGLPNPIVARINNDRVLLDFRTIQEEELSLIYESMKWFMETEGLS